MDLKGPTGGPKDGEGYPSTTAWHSVGGRGVLSLAAVGGRGVLSLAAVPSQCCCSVVVNPPLGSAQITLTVIE